MNLQPEFLEMIEDDIRRIDSIVKSGTKENQWELFREIDGRYQTCIADFYKGMWEYMLNEKIIYFPSLKESPELVIDNLKMAKSKLEVFRYQANAKPLTENTSTTVSVVNNLNLSISFEQVRSKIEDMTSLTDKETEEILQKISELENIVNSKDKKKNKWEKTKSILVWLANKSFDVGMTILPLLLKIQEN